MSEDPLQVLVVDDDFRVAGIHAAYVSRVDGFTVVGQAHSAADARRLVDELRPDTVLLDVYLPDGDGLELARCWRDTPDGPDVIMITAARDVATVRTAMQLGAVHYLVKPFGFADLRDRLLAHHRMRSRLARLGDAKQADVDELYDLLRVRQLPSQLPKGHSAPTLELVRAAVLAAAGALSAHEVGEGVGISRATAQRYLSFLARHGVLELTLNYSTNGRPEHRYRAPG